MEYIQGACRLIRESGIFPISFLTPENIPPKMELSQIWEDLMSNEFLNVDRHMNWPVRHTPERILKPQCLKIRTPNTNSRGVMNI